MQAVKEIVLKGFDYENPKTKSLVIWVAGDEADIARVIDTINDDILSVEDMDIGLDVGDALGIDFKFPEKEQEFLDHVQSVLERDYS